MPSIEVDREVYRAVVDLAGDSEDMNAALRRLLQLPDAPSDDYVSGKLHALLIAGRLQPGDELQYRDNSTGKVFRATVEADGWTRTTLGRHSSATAALSSLVGRRVNGWQGWKHVRTGRTLRSLQSDLLDEAASPDGPVEG